MTEEIKKVKTVITTPLGTAIFPALITATEGLDKELAYSVWVRLTTAEADKIKAEALAMIKPKLVKMMAANGVTPEKATWSTNWPWRPAKDRDKNVIPGMTDIKIFQHKNGSDPRTGKKWENRPPIYDANIQPWNMQTEIGFGSRIRVSLSPYPWHYAGKYGMSYGLVGVQVVQLVQSGPRSAEDMGFEQVDAASLPAVTGQVSAPTEDKDRPVDEAQFHKELKEIQEQFVK
jgi:hypothetical protein